MKLKDLSNSNIDSNLKECIMKQLEDPEMLRFYIWNTLNKVNNIKQTLEIVLEFCENKLKNN